MTVKPMAMVGRKHEALHTAAEPIEVIDGALWSLAARMRATLIKLQGAGLAAPQVGQSKALVVTATGDVVLNPRVELDGRMVPGPEGCLSLPGRCYEVERAERCTLFGVNLAGDETSVGITGFLARLWQHEVDHLDGVLICESWPEIGQAS